jgi:ABC-type antimicrobial peptide transport system permease subunit
VLAGLAATIALAAMADWPLASLSTAALAGLAASVCVGLAAASYPAWQAARVDSMRVLA